MKTRKREIAKAGIFGSVENPVIVLESDLKEIAETFPEIGKAPIQLGHWPDAEQPRLGNVVGVTYDEATKTLYGEIEEEDALAQAVEDGYYPDVSIGAKSRATDGKMYLHHLAYLGEEAPAIKDLKDEIKTSLGIAACDKTGVRMLPGTMEKRLYLSDEPKKTDPPGEGGKENNVDDKQKVAELEAENQKLKEQNQAQEKMLSDAMKVRKEEEKAALKKAVEGKLTEAQTQKLMALADSCEGGRTIELADGESKRQVGPISILAEVFEDIPLKVKPGKLDLSDGEQQPAEINFNAI